MVIPLFRTAYKSHNTYNTNNSYTTQAIIRTIVYTKLYAQLSQLGSVDFTMKYSTGENMDANRE